MQMRIAEVRQLVHDNTPRIMDLGNWSERARARAEESLLGRIPTPEKLASGFDAGIACCLDLIPRELQTLAATLHANYTPEAVAQVRREIKWQNALSGTAYWLAACLHCINDRKISETEFMDQVRGFEADVCSSSLIMSAAREQLDRMLASFEVRDGIAHIAKNGGMQGAYIAGHELAVEWSAKHGIYFVGTFHPSLGLGEFAFSKLTDAGGRNVSGLITDQFAKCTPDELEAVLGVVRKHLRC